MMLAAALPELCGPIIVAGAPLSYWNGVRGRNPMRYSGGLLGGSWLTASPATWAPASSTAPHLVQNFENMNPSNTLWTKQHHLYADIDTEGPRYLAFERWWGGHVLLNAEEMQWIVDNLFVGNRLATAEIVTGDGVQLDFRNIASPIVCFCSEGDDITPPQQALGWILDLYGSVDDIRANGQTIVYCVHDKVGHLGIFVSGSVAKKEHAEFADNIDLIDCLPPGLYEAVLTPADAQESRDGLVVGDYVARFEQRTLDAIRALGGNDLQDEREFAAVARSRRSTSGLYRTFLQPWVRAAVTPAAAETLQRLGRRAPAVRADLRPQPPPGAVGRGGGPVRENREPVAKDNPFVAAEQLASPPDRRRARRLARPARRRRRGPVPFGLRLALGPGDAGPARLGRPAPAAAGARAGRDRLRAGTDGGPARPDGRGRHARGVRPRVRLVRQPQLAADERGFRMLQKLRDEHAKDVTLARFKQLVRDQFMMVLLDPEEAIETLPKLLAGREAKAPASSPSWTTCSPSAAR